MTKFKTFHPYRYTDKVRGGCTCNAANHLNEWLEENPKVEIISWQACPVGDRHELYITIQYREREED